MAKGPTVTMWRRTMIIVIGLVVIGIGAILITLIRLQLVQGGELKKAAIEQQMTDTSVEAKRGTITDANDKVLAQSASVWKVVLEPKTLYPGENATEKEIQRLEQVREFLKERLPEVLDMKASEIEDAMSKSDSYYELLKRQIETEERQKVLDLKKELVEEYQQSSGILLETDVKRYYPYGALAGSVLGFVGADGSGLSGLELYYDDYLTGTAGRVVSVKDSLGGDTPYEESQMVDAEDGYNLKLTIDVTIQNILEKYLNEGIVTNNVHNGAVAICMNVKTGAILGLANANDFDPNDPYTIVDQEAIDEISQITGKTAKAKAETEALQVQWRNKAITETYYPGSVFKMVTLSMALEENLVKESDTFTCVGAMQVDDRTINCHLRSGHGTEDVVHGTMNSCNPMFMWLGFKIGTERFLDYFEAFGFADLTGVDLPAESASIYQKEDDMNNVDLAVYSFGQNFSITPIQMVTACSAIANGGNLMQPYVVSQITDSDGNIVKTTESIVKRQVISKDVSDRVKQILYQNAVEGTAKNGYVAGYRVCGKTGTSEKVSKYNEEGGEAKGAVMQYIASYCGFAPVEDPEIALLVFYDEPDVSGNYYGGSVAGPVFANMMSEILPYIGVEAEYTDDEAAELDLISPTLIGEKVDEATQQAEAEGLTVLVYGSGDTVLSQNPEPGIQISSGGRVALFTDEESQKQTTEVPNLVGMSYSEAKYSAEIANLQIKSTGVSAKSASGVSSAQSIEAGTKVLPGTVITVNFITKDAVQ